jgi:uncharacterized RDD family membrane protein YckC
VTAFEKLTIDTPEQIALEFTLAGVGSRFIAIAVDTLIQAALLLLAYIAAILFMLTGAVDASSLWVLAIVVLVVFVLMYGYFALFEWLWQGRTPGKRTAGLRVISANGLPLTPYQAFVRNLLRIVDQLPVLYGVGIGVVLFTERGQRLGDLVAGTVVVREDAARRETFAPEPPSATGTRGRLPSVARLTDAELALAERFLQRRADLDVHVREERARQIAIHLRQRLELREEGRDEELIERLVAEYRSGGVSQP